MKLLVFSLFLSAKVFSQIYFEKIPIDTSYSFRGLSVVDDSTAWASGNGFARTTDGGKNWIFKKVKTFETEYFRSIYAFSAQSALIANAGSPAYILRTTDGGENWQVVYQNNASLAFFDGIDFWNEDEGIIYGDPIDGHIFLLHTTDGGLNWMKMENRPELFPGEASFAASGTGIRCYENGKIIFSSGGTVSRMFFSDDKGKKWTIIQPPILQGKNSTGIFSFAFKNNFKGIIVGGDYLADTLKNNHVLYTTDAGKTWHNPVKQTGGYRECVEFINDSTAIAVGPEGTDISYNSGKEWTAVHNEKHLHVIRKARKGNLVIAAGKKKISIVRTVK